MIATAVAYLPTLRNDFVDFDDQTNLIENPHFRGLGLTALRWMFTDLDGHYLPLTWLSFAIDHQLWGMNPVGYHLTNLLLHLANAIVFYRLSARLLRLVFGVRAGAETTSLFIAAGISAAVFALHPLRVESVAWATERRDVLSGLFALLMVDSYLAFHERRPHGVAWRALGWYVLSLLAKPVGMSLPIVLIVLDAYPLRRLPARVAAWTGRDVRHVWLEKVPFIALGVATAVVEAIAEQAADTFYSLAQYGVAGRLGQAFYALAFYVRKTVVPVALSPLYQLPVGWRFMRDDVLLSAAFVLALTVALYMLRRRWPWALAVWVIYGALLAPVLGIAQAGPHIVADRYSYLATLGLAVVAGGAVLAIDRRFPREGSIVGFRGAVVAASLVALGLGVLTWNQIGVWRDSITLWRTAVAADPACYICLNNLGNAFVRAGRGTEAPPYFDAAMRIQPGDADANANLGAVAMQAGNAVEARRYFDRALALDPGHAVAHTNIARLLLDDGEAEKALPHLEAALRKEPEMAEARTNLGLAFLQRGDLPAAERELRRALAAHPDLATAHNNLGTVLLQSERREEAADEFRRASALDPTFPEPRYNLGLTLAALDRADDAIAALRDAVRLRPAYASAQQKLVELLVATGRDAEARTQAAAADAVASDTGASAALVLSYMERGRARDAIVVLREMLAKDPADADSASMLAWLLATAADAELRDGAAAVALAERAVAAAGGAPDADRLDTLAAAYAESKRFDDAVTTGRRALAVAKTSENSDLADEIAARLAAYEQGRPYRSE